LVAAIDDTNNKLNLNFNTSLLDNIDLINNIQKGDDDVNSNHHSSLDLVESPLSFGQTNDQSSDPDIEYLLKEVSRRKQIKNKIKNKEKASSSSSSSSTSSSSLSSSSSSSLQPSTLPPSSNADSLSILNKKTEPKTSIKEKENQKKVKFEQTNKAKVEKNLKNDNSKSKIKPLILKKDELREIQGIIDSYENKNKDKNKNKSSENSKSKYIFNGIEVFPYLTVEDQIKNINQM
jgi:hypothetical protein